MVEGLRGSWPGLLSLGSNQVSLLAVQATKAYQVSSGSLKGTHCVLANVGDMWEGERIHLELREERKKFR